ncbi:hypothetical protein PVAP13_3NG248994 [Panicum virgatum]|uniref:Uncharacterized protein n=2 Tax=Panicum virgatum TaxID=38727 RepID=A0A8T0U0Y0_PANVG|nr:hypothetical protein PVAP13_3NG248994 [Panicum virgatum]
MCGSPVLSIHFFSPACSQQPYPFAPVARVFPIHPFLLSQRHLLGEHRREGGRRRFLGRAPARSRGGASWGEHRQGMRSVEGGWKTLAESQTLLRCLSTVPPSSSSSPSSSALFPPPLAPISSSHRRADLTSRRLHPRFPRAVVLLPQQEQYLSSVWAASAAVDSMDSTQHIHPDSDTSSLIFVM